MDYKDLFEKAGLPKDIDYLQIDLEVSNKSTLEVLELLNKTIMDDYRFATVTFEHDIYRGDYHNTRQASREIFASRGYVMVFGDVSHHGNKFEDWYVHPDLVDMNQVNLIKTERCLSHQNIGVVLTSLNTIQEYLNS